MSKAMILCVKKGCRLHNTPCGKIKRAAQGIGRKGATLPLGLDKIKVDEGRYDSHCGGQGRNIPGAG